MAAVKKEARTGSPPGRLPLRNTFDWCFGQPFVSENDYTPASHKLPHIEDSRPIFVDNQSDRSLTYGQISKDALAISSGLLGLGLDPNALHKLPPTETCRAGAEIAPVVLLQLPNSLPFPPLLLGIFAAGLTATLASPALTSEELSWILQNARPSVIVTAKACLQAMRGAIEKQEDRAYFAGVPVYTVDVPRDKYPLPSSAEPSSPDGNEKDWKALLRSTPRPRPAFPAAAAPDRTAVLLWSSGTSGRSKGVLLSHQALNFSMAHLWHDADYYRGEPQRWLGYVPFYHVFGLCNVLILAVATGSTVYTMPAFSLDVMLAAIPKRRVTYMHMAPPIAVMLAKAPNVEPYARRDAAGRNAFSTVAGAVTGGAPLGHEVVVEVHRRCGFRVRLGYGLSETCSTSLQRGLGEAEMHAHAGDTGRPHWGVEIKIAAVDGSADPPTLRTDEEGEILIRAPCLMTAYLPAGFLAGAAPDMTATRDALAPGGWFRTGDVGALCVEGRLRITDRLKELIKVRAYQVAPAELEAALCGSDKVADAGVVGVYDAAEATEWPRAFVVPRRAGQTRAELEALARELKEMVEKRTARYKWLVGGMVFVEQIPKSPSGKILRRVLRAGEGIKGTEVVLYQPKRRAAKL